MYDSLPSRSDEVHFEEDIQKIHAGYKMLDNIEKRLKGYLEKGEGSVGGLGLAG